MDVYNKLVIHIKERRKNVRRYYRFKAKDLANMPDENPYAKSMKIKDAQRSDDSLEVLERKIGADDQEQRNSVGSRTSSQYSFHSSHS